MTNEELHELDLRMKLSRDNRGQLAAIKANAEKLSTGELVVVLSYASDCGKYAPIRADWSADLVAQLNVTARQWFERRAQALDEEFGRI